MGKVFFSFVISIKYPFSLIPIFKEMEFQNLELLQSLLIPKFIFLINRTFMNEN